MARNPRTPRYRLLCALALLLESQQTVDISQLRKIDCRPWFSCFYLDVEESWFMTYLSPFMNGALCVSGSTHY
jgi:hypothetical protein